jgi:hypothetical protein
MTRVMEAWLARDRLSSWTVGRAKRTLGHPGRVPGWAASRVTGCGFQFVRARLPALEDRTAVSSRLWCPGVRGRRAVLHRLAVAGAGTQRRRPVPAYAAVLVQPPRPITASHDEAGRISTVPA